MRSGARWDGRTLERIVVLLFALADLALRAGTMSLPLRFVVLAILRHAEAVAWAFAIGEEGVPAASGAGGRWLRSVAGQGGPVGCHAPVEPARLALSLRALALIIAGWVFQLRASRAAASARGRAVRAGRARTGAGWPGPAALPAPDTS